MPEMVEISVACGRCPASTNLKVFYGSNEIKTICSECGASIVLKPPWSKVFDKTRFPVGRPKPEDKDSEGYSGE